MDSSCGLHILNPFIPERTQAAESIKDLHKQLTASSEIARSLCGKYEDLANELSRLGASFSSLSRFDEGMMKQVGGCVRKGCLISVWLRERTLCFCSFNQALFLAGLMRFAAHEKVQSMNKAAQTHTLQAGQYTEQGMKAKTRAGDLHEVAVANTKQHSTWKNLSLRTAASLVTLHDYATLLPEVRCVCFVCCSCLHIHRVALMLVLSTDACPSQAMQLSHNVFVLQNTNRLWPL